MKKTLTVKFISSLEPCNVQEGEVYSPTGLRKLFKGNSISPLDLSRLHISVDDRLWVLLHPQILGPRNFHHLMEDCIGRFPDARAELEDAKSSAKDKEFGRARANAWCWFPKDAISTSKWLLHRIRKYLTGELPK